MKSNPEASFPYPSYMEQHEVMEWIVPAAQIEETIHVIAAKHPEYEAWI